MSSSIISTAYAVGSLAYNNYDSLSEMGHATLGGDFGEIAARGCEFACSLSAEQLGSFAGDVACMMAPVPKRAGGAAAKGKGANATPGGTKPAAPKPNIKNPKAPVVTDKWSRAPKSIQDKMTLEAAMRGEGKRLKIELGDPRYKDMDKMHFSVTSAAGRQSVVHYIRDPVTGELMDFKFKKHSID